MSTLIFPKGFASISQRVEERNDTVFKVWESVMTYEKGEGHSAYESYPLLFTPVFPPITEEQLVTLSQAGSLLVKSVLALDSVIDVLVGDMHCERATAHDIAQNICKMQALQFEADRLLASLFPPSSAFWDEYRVALRDVLEGMYEERLLAFGYLPRSAHDEETAIRRIIKQNALAKVAVSALAYLTGEDIPKASLMTSIDHYNVARQLYDDLVDWKEDVRLAKPSLLMMRIVDTWPPEPDQMKEYAYRLYFKGHATHILDLALHHLQIAEEAVAQWPRLPWRKIMVDRLQTRVRMLRTEIEEAVTRNLTRARHRPQVHVTFKASLGSLDVPLARGLEYLITQWKKDFGEAKHLFKFPREQFHVQTVNQLGDIFSRAIILENLLHIQHVVDASLSQIIDYDITYILSRRRRDEVGGWAYFPDLMELPPDTDDLAQIMHVLLQLGRTDDVRRYCEPPLRVLLTHGVRDDGGIETWIVPRPPCTSEQRLQLEYIHRYWGHRVDVEVVANLVYALALYDYPRFRDVVDRAATYLEEAQHPNGSWFSTWYHGPFYGTWVVMRALRLVRPDSPALKAGRQFLLDARKSDGGWGLGDNVSDPLSTALALLALSLMGGKNIDVRPAVDFLLVQQKQDGGWAAVPFIKMDISDRIATYASRVITSAYVLRTLINTVHPVAETIFPVTQDDLVLARSIME